MTPRGADSSSKMDCEMIRAGRHAPAGLAGLLLLLAGLSASRAQSAGSPPPPRESARSDRERYIELLAKKERLERLNELWKVEADLAAKRTTYAVLNLSERKLYFKVRGRAFKAISFTGLEATRRSEPVDLGQIAWRAFTLQIKEGKGVETESIQRKVLSPEEAQKAGRSDAEGEPIGAEQGVVESGAVAPGGTPPAGAGGADSAAAGAAPTTQKMAGVAGGAIPPDPPPKYHMGFDGDLSLWVVAEVSPTPRAARYETFLTLARWLGRLLVGTPEEARETRLTVRLPLNLGQQIYRQLLPGQRLLITL